MHDAIKPTLILGANIPMDKTSYEMLIWGETSHLGGMSHLSGIPVEHWISLSEHILLIWEWVHLTYVRSTSVYVRLHKKIKVFTCIYRVPVQNTQYFLKN